MSALLKEVREGRSLGASKEVWSYLEVDDRRFHETAGAVATEARRLADLIKATPCAVILADMPEGAVGFVSSFGISKIYAPRDHAPDGPLTAEAAAEALSLLAMRFNPTALLLGATIEGNEIGARVAAKLGRGIITNCVEFELEGNKLVGRRPVYGGKAHLRLTWTSPEPFLATIDRASLEAIEQSGGDAELVLVEMNPLELRAERTGHWCLPPAEIDLTEAQFIIGVGKGVQNQESMDAVRTLAERIGAAVGGSRIAVFQGLVPLERQIGSTGRWISPDVYLTLGISGASYHVMGIRGAKHIIAVNTDRNAPILKLAELGIVGDLHQVVLAMLDTVSASDGSQGRPS